MSRGESTLRSTESSRFEVGWLRGHTCSGHKLHGYFGLDYNGQGRLESVDLLKTFPQLGGSIAV